MANVNPGAQSVTTSQKLVRARADAAHWEPAEEGERNSEAMRHAARLVVDFELADAEASPILQDWNAGNVSPLDEAELRKCLLNGRRYGKNPPGCALARLRPQDTKRGTDTVPRGVSPSWWSIREIGELPEYRQGLHPIPTTYPVLDDYLGGGFRPECLYIVGGRAGSAKSTFAINIVRRVALVGQSVLLLKLEEAPKEATWRMHAAASKTDLRVFLDGPASMQAHAGDITDAWKILCTLPIRISNERDLGGITAVARKHADEGGRLIVLDQLSMVQVPDVALAYERATKVSNTLRLLSRDLHIPILAVSQVNREASKTRKAGDLESADLRESGHLEADAAVVMMIDRMNLKRAFDPKQPEVLGLSVTKNRYGRRTERGKPIELRWWPPTHRIETATGLRPAGTQ